MIKNRLKEKSACLKIKTWNVAAADRITDLPVGSRVMLGADTQTGNLMAPTAGSLFFFLCKQLVIKWLLFSLFQQIFLLYWYQGVQNLPQWTWRTNICTLLNQVGMWELCSCSNCTGIDMLTLRFHPNALFITSCNILQHSCCSISFPLHLLRPLLFPQLTTHTAALNEGHLEGT